MMNVYMQEENDMQTAAPAEGDAAADTGMGGDMGGAETAAPAPEAPATEGGETPATEEQTM